MDHSVRVQNKMRIFKNRRKKREDGINRESERSKAKKDQELT